MKKLLRLFFVISFVAITIQSIAQIAVRDTAFMQANQTNDVYYSLKTGTSGNPVLTNWDIAFYTNPFSDGIITNDGSGVVLYSYPNGDSSAWSTVDTNGLSTWTKMFNADTNWQFGAFNKNAQGHPDYGWGVYNQVTHNLTGDSIFVIKLVSGQFKKLRILKKESAANVFYIRFANLDGTNQTDASINCSTAASKLFLAYSITNNATVDREPLKADWDLKFTKYMFPGYGPIQGVLTNEKIAVAKRFPLDTASNVYTNLNYDTAHINTIGYSWKSMGVVKDSLVYFIKDRQGNIFKFIFESYSTPTGKIGFRKVKLLDVGGISNSVNSLSSSVIYPNPAANNFSLIIDNKETENITTTIYDLSGKQVLNRNLGELPVGLNAIDFDTFGLKNGLYFMQISNGKSQHSVKFVVNK